MDRSEQTLNQAAAAETEASARLLADSGFADSRSVRQNLPNATQDAEKIAGCFDFRKSTEKMDDGAKLLGDDLRAFSSNKPAYNSFLKDIAGDIKAIDTSGSPMAAELKLGGLSPNTGTYKNAFIYINADSWDSHEAYRIVQPGNTLSQIVKDSYDDLVQVNKDNGGVGFSRADYMKGIVARNHISDPNKLYVGQVLKMSKY